MHPCTHVGDQKKLLALGFGLAQPCPVLTTRGVNQQMDFSLLSPYFSVTDFKNKYYYYY